MDTHENAAMAICQLSGHNVNGRPLKCSWGKDRPPTGQLEGNSPQQPQTPNYSQASPAYGFPQYGGPQAMTSQGGRYSAGSISGYPNQQSPMGAPGPASRGYQGYGGQGSPGMAPQYGQMPSAAEGVPGKAGGYGRPDQIHSALSVQLVMSPCCGRFVHEICNDEESEKTGKRWICEKEQNSSTSSKAWTFSRADEYIVHFAMNPERI